VHSPASSDSVRIKIVQRVSLVLLVLVLSAAPIRQFIHPMPGLVLLGICLAVLFLLGSIWFSRLEKLVLLSPHLLLWAGYLLSLGGILKVAGLHAPIYPLILLMPILAGFLAGRGVAIFYAVVSLGVTILTYLNFPRGLGGGSLPMDASFDQAKVMVFSAVILLSLGISFVYEKVWREAMLDKERLIQNRTDFLASVSHEIRTPLNGIVGSLDLIHDGLSREEILEMLHILKTSTSKLETTLNDFLDFARVDAGKLTIAWGAVDLPLVLSRTEALFRDTAKRKGLEFRLYTADDVPRWIESDAVRLGQVLNNLVSNAIKYTEHGFVHIRVRMAGEDLLVEIQDSGPGIGKEYIDRIFHPYEQVPDEQEERTLVSTGLGLTIAMRLAELMHGRLEYQRMEPTGSLFRLILPAKTAANAADSSGPEGSGHTGTGKGIPQLAGLSVLVAEDDHFNQLLIERMLVKLGSRPVLVENGEAAIEECSRQEFDLIFLDLQMPVLGGIDTCRALRSRFPDRTMHIAALTADAIKETRQECEAAGMDGFLEKPLRMERLKEYLLQFLKLDNVS
jgi:signal transduction histidine kinase